MAVKRHRVQEGAPEQWVFREERDVVVESDPRIAPQIAVIEAQAEDVDERIAKQRRQNEERRPEKGEG